MYISTYIHTYSEGEALGWREGCGCGGVRVGEGVWVWVRVWCGGLGLGWGEVFVPSRFKE